ncbi:PEP-CTERM sorting domain-containing protein [Phragmitibacter flavus]|uniref:PEP-CTERM sorting domain-containing protein n=1 Tax=Phragmitibacter flavus TaxID=2576071 RepID=A0A5R8KEA0_9BACT|nr:PEP-CTERM sorting domain-containing protein [Phragmitibacter flavus]TLD70636.1 PEP-CTERM sorting domain-containing protein [Phragmitibacter flavus]
MSTTMKIQVFNFCSVAAFGIFCAASSVSAQSYIGHATDNVISLIDTATGASSTFYSGTGMNLNGLAWSEANQRFYVIDTTDPAGQRFYSIDPLDPMASLTDEGILLNSLGNQLAFPVYGATIDNSGSGLYLGIVTTSSILSTWTLDGGNAVSQTTLNLGSTGWSGLQLGDLSIDGNGALWISATNINITQTALLRYSSVAAAIAGNAPTVFHFNTSSAASLMNGLGYDPLTDTLHGFRAVNGSFFEIDQTTAVVSVINNTNPLFDLQGDLSDAFVAAVPEPSSALFTAVAGMIILLRRRRPGFAR